MLSPGSTLLVAAGCFAFALASWVFMPAVLRAFYGSVGRIVFRRPEIGARLARYVRVRTQLTSLFLRIFGTVALVSGLGRLGR